MFLINFLTVKFKEISLFFFLLLLIMIREEGKKLFLFSSYKYLVVIG